MTAQLRPNLSVSVLPDQTARIHWAGSVSGFALESSDQIGSATVWSAVPEVPVLRGNEFEITIRSTAARRYYRLRSQGAAVTTFSSSPANGEEGVAVTRETVLNFSQPLAAEQVLMLDSLRAEFGNRRLLARTELSADRRTATLFYLENLPANARVRVIFEGDIVKDAEGRAVDGDGDGNPGGRAVIDFDTLSTTPVPRTAVIGRVFASELVGTNSVNRPLGNVTITVDGAEETLRTVTGPDGNFKLMPAPAGRFFVHVDGRTATGSTWPGGAYYPFVGKAWEAIAGKEDNLAGGSGEIFLPLVSADALQPVSPVTATRIEFPPDVLAQNPQLAGVSLTVPPNALYSDSGTRGGKVGIAPVPADRLPEPLPDDLRFPLVITIQTDGPQNFSVPVPVRFPNLPDSRTGQKLPPGGKSALWGFDHDLGTWRIQGGMTVTADGNFVETNPGVGALEPGWYGTQPGCEGRDGEIERECEPTEECSLGDISMFSDGRFGRRRFSVPLQHTPGIVNWYAPTATDIQGQAGTVFTAFFCTAGTHTVRAVLSPQCGDPCEKSFTFTVTQEEIDQCEAGTVTLPPMPIKIGQTLTLNLASSSSLGLPGTPNWTAASGSPSTGTGTTFTTRYCTPGTYTIRWSVRTPCGRICEDSAQITVADGQCELTPFDLSLNPGPYKLGDTIALTTQASLEGTVTWQIGSGQAYLDLVQEMEVGEGAAMLVSYCTPGRQTIRATLRTRCGQVCEQSTTVDIGGAECSLEPLDFSLAPAPHKTGSTVAITTAASVPGTVTWQIGNGEPLLDLVTEVSSGELGAAMLVRYCTPGSYTIKATLTTKCGRVCERSTTIQVQDNPCDMTPLRVDLGTPVVGGSFAVFTTVNQDGTIVWTAEDGQGEVVEPGPPSLPDESSGYDAFAIIKYTSRGLKTIRATFTTKCGQVCPRVLIVDVQPAPPPPFEPDDAPLQQEIAKRFGRKSDSSWWGEAPSAEMKALFDNAFSAQSQSLRAQAAPERRLQRQPGIHYFFIENLDTGRIRRGRAGQNGFAHARSITLASNTRYREIILQGSTLNVATIQYTTPDDGQTFTIPNFLLGPDTSADTDQDGLTDLAEQILGTDSTRSDSDGDGALDSEEARRGTSASLAQDELTGVVAVIDTPGNAQDVTTFKNVAVVANGEGGVSVFNIFNGLAPALIAEVDTPGEAGSVAPTDDFIAVADGPSGLALLNITDPPGAFVQRQINLGSPVRAVAAALGTAYAGLENGDVVAVDLVTGSELKRRSVSGAVHDLVLGGDHLYVLTDGQVHALNSELSIRGSAIVASNLGDPRARLFVGGGLIYAVDAVGYDVFTLSSPEQPTLRAAIETAQTGWKQVIPDGTGLALAAVDGSSGDGGQNDVLVYNLAPNGTNSIFLETLPTPGIARSATIHNGLGYVADGANGLVVIRYRAADRGRIAPTITLSTRFVDRVAEENKPLTVTANVNDDVQVRNVDFYVDGRLAGSDGSFPFEFRFLTPAMEGGRSVFRLQARATDTAGNVGDTGDLVFTLVRDATPPRVIGTSPEDFRELDEYLPMSIAFLYDDAVDPATVLPGMFKVFGVGPDNQLGTEDDALVPNGTVAASSSPPGVFVSFPVLQPGFYHAILAPGIADRAGNRTTEEESFIFSVPRPAVRSTFPNDSDLPGGTLSQVSVQFAGLIDPATVTPNSFKLVTAGPDGQLQTDDDLPVPGGLLSFDKGSRTAAWTFAEPLKPGHYLVRVLPSIVDLSGIPLDGERSFGFKLDPPAVRGFSPPNNSYGIGVISTLALDFAQPMKPELLNSSTFQLVSAGVDGAFGTTDDQRIAGVVNYLPDTQQLTFRTAPLGKGRYRAILSGSVQDFSNTPLGQDFIANFTVREQELIWVGTPPSGNGSSFNPTNWAPAELPLPNDRIIINRPGDYVVDGSRPQGFPTEITLAAFTLGGTDARPTVVLSNRVHYRVSRGIIIRPGAAIRSASRGGNPGLTSTEFLNQGTILVDTNAFLDINQDGELRMNFVNEGVVNADGTIQFRNVEFRNTGVIRVAGEGIIDNSAIQIDSSGLWEWTGVFNVGSSTFNLLRDLTNGVGGAFLSSSDTFGGPGKLINRGEMRLQDSVLNVPVVNEGNLELITPELNTTITNRGTLVLISGQRLASATGRVENHGTVILSSQTLFTGGKFENLPGSSVRGSGTLDIRTTQSRFAGRIEPVTIIQDTSDLTAAIEVQGPLSFEPTTTLEIQIGGIQDFEYDRVTATLDLTVSGSLALSLVDGFLPEIGRTFPILMGRARMGEFQNVTGRAIDATRHFEIRYTPTGVELFVVAGP